MEKDAKKLSKDKKKQFKTLGISLCLFAVFLAYMFFRSHQEGEELTNNPVHSYGIVVKKSAPAAKGGWTIHYEYKINGVSYNGSSRYMHHLETINIGDTCEIIYAKTNPEISSVLELENGLLNIRGKQKRFGNYKLLPPQLDNSE